MRIARILLCGTVEILSLAFSLGKDARLRTSEPCA